MPTQSQSLRLSLLAALVFVNSASGYDVLTEGGTCPNGFTWTSDPAYVVYYVNAPSALEELQFINAAIDLTDRINNVSGQSFDFQPLTSSGAQIGPLLADNGDGIADGINEIALVNLSVAGSTVLGLGPAIVDASNCTVEQADVLLSSLDTWYYGVPEDEGKDYFNAPYEDTSTNPSTYFIRQGMLHEMLHNVSLAHSDSTYSFMNYVTRPWSNRAREKQIEPLPDDREALRDFYGTGTGETDVAALVTWFDGAVVSSSGAATGKLLCQPSRGAGGFSPSIFDPTCGVKQNGDDGSTNVCAGDLLRVRWAIANYGTSDMDVDSELWFSADPILDRTSGVDVQSTTAATTVTVQAETSARKGRSFEVPAGLAEDTDYYPIMFLETGSELANEESDQNNWIPLRGPIHTKAAADCP